MAKKTAGAKTTAKSVKAKPAKATVSKKAVRPGKPVRASKPGRASKQALPERLSWKPGNVVLPAPAALVSCRRPGGTPNLITIAWCGNINSTPPMLSISVRPERHSHAILVETGEFVVNIPSTSLAREVDYCGVASGRDVDKFAATGLTPCAVPGVSAPAVAECPVSIACRVTKRLSLGSHDMFLAEVVGVTVAPGLLDKAGAFRLEAAKLLCYAHGTYFDLGKKRGFFGWSVQKKKPVAGKKKPRAGRKA